MLFGSLNHFKFIICAFSFQVHQSGSNRKHQKSCDKSVTARIFCFLCFLHRYSVDRNSFHAGLLAQASTQRPSSHSLCCSDLLNATLPLQWRDRAGLTPASLLARLHVHATIENMKRDLVLLDYIIHVLCRKGVFFYYIKPRS